MTDRQFEPCMTDQQAAFLFFVQEVMGNSNACDGPTSKHERLNWCGMTGFLHVPSDPSQGENMKDSQRLEPQFTLSLTGFMHVLVID